MTSVAALPEQDGPGQVEFDLLQPGIALLVQQPGVRQVVVVQQLLLVLWPAVVLCTAATAVL